MSIADNYPFPDSFPKEKLMRLVQSSDFELFQEMLMARAVARQAAMVACDAGFDTLRQIQGGIREDLWLANLRELASEMLQAQDNANLEQARRGTIGRDMFGPKSSAKRPNPFDRTFEE